MTTADGNGEIRPLSEASMRRIRVIRVTPRGGGPDITLLFVETVPIHSAPKQIDQEYLAKSIGPRFTVIPTFVAYAENTSLSALATRMYAALRGTTEESNLLRALEQFVCLSESLGAMQSSRL